MALSNAERQARYRQKVKTGELSRIDAKLPHEIAIKLNYLTWHWQCTKAEALGCLLMEAWEREGRPLPGDDSEEELLLGNSQTGRQVQQTLQRAEKGFPTAPPEKAPPRPAEAQRRGPGPRSIARWQREAEKRVLNGLTAIMEHFTSHSRYEGMTYAGIRDLLSETDYEIACRVEIRSMQGRGMNGTAIARALNEKAVPPPARSGRGKWTASQVRAFMA
jgi:hypothetical protein